MSDFAQSKLSLQPHIAAGRTKNSVVFSNPLTNREIAISGWTEPVSLLNSSSVLRAVLGRLSKANAQSLLHELRSASFLVDEVRIKTRQTTQRAWTVSLARAIASPYSISRKFIVVHTKCEALVLPAGLSDSVWMESLRLFLSGVRPIQLRKCYAFGATSGYVTVVGDEGDSEGLNSVRERYRDIATPFVVSLVDSANSSQFGMAPGRLHPAQSVIDQEIVIGPDIVIHRSGAAMACPDLRFCDIDPNPWAWGHSSDISVARSKAIAESVERYATGTVPYRKLTLCSANELKGPYLDPVRCLSFTDTQIRRHPDLREFKPEEPRYWVMGERADSEPTYVLADLVYNPFVPPNSMDQRVHCRANSSGVAFARSKESAQRRAFLECHERHAFLRCWYGHLSPPRLRIDSLPALAERYVEAVVQKGFTVHLLVLSTAIPVIAAVGIADDAMLIGCAAGSPAQAVEKALTELSMALTGLPVKRPTRPAEILRADDHTMLYREPAMIRRATFLVESNETVNLSSLTWNGEVPIQGEIYFVRLPVVTNSEDHVWRCIAPEYIPMNFGYDTEPRGRRDVAELLDSVKPGHRLYYEGDALLPHPFA